MKLSYAGYADFYITKKWDDPSLENQAKLEVYKILYRIDHCLGTTSELQLWTCCQMAVNTDIIEVIDN